MAGREWGISALTAAVVAGVVATVIGNPIDRALHDRPAPRVPPTHAQDTVPEPVIVEPTTPEPQAPTDVEPSTDPAPVPLTFDLTEMPPISAGSDVKAPETAQLRGSSYLHSVVYACSLVCDQPRGVVEYNLGEGFTTFRALVGVDDRAEESDQVGTFEVYLDGTRVGRWQTTSGHPKTIRVDVSGHLRLRLVAGREGTVAGSIAQAVQAGANMATGVSNHLPYLVWADPTLHR